MAFDRAGLRWCLFVLPAGATLWLGSALGACSSSSPPSEAPGSGGSAAAQSSASTSGSVTSNASSGSGSPSDGGPDADGGDGCSNDGGVPDDLACTGLYSDWATRTIAADVEAYTPGLLLWSDGADKQRWIHLPAGSTIDTTDMDNWVFPDGTKIWKQFTLNGKTIETRLLWKDAGAWNFVDYRWSDDGTSAHSLVVGEKNVNGTTFEIPSISECYACHNGRNDYVLGFDLLGVGVSAAQGVTLAKLVSTGRLTSPPPATTITIPEDATNLAAPTLGWLHVNCGATCHNSSLNAGAVQTKLYMKLLSEELYPMGNPATVAALDTYTTSVNVMSNFLVDNTTPYPRIAPGDSANSLVSLFTVARAPDAGGFLPMPPIISHIADTADVAALNAWIDALK